MQPGSEPNVLKRLSSFYADRGSAALAGKIIKAVGRRIADAVWGAWYAAAPGKDFSFRGKPLPYLRHFYNTTWKNERTVEVPIAFDWVRARSGARILEVGNVLRNYGPSPAEVVDKYEPGEGIINEDIAEFAPAEPYPYIVSVSTMEHVGWDEIPREPEKLLRAFEHLKRNVLAPGGEMLVTMPLGMNSFLDGALRSGALDFSESHFLLRISAGNDWREASWEEVRDAAYGSPYPAANAVIIGIYKKPSA